MVPDAGPGGYPRSNVGAYSQSDEQIQLSLQKKYRNESRHWAIWDLGCFGALSHRSRSGTGALTKPARRRLATARNTTMHHTGYGQRRERGTGMGGKGRDSRKAARAELEAVWSSSVFGRRSQRWAVRRIPRRRPCRTACSAGRR